MPPANSRTAVLVPTALPAWVAAEPVTSPLPVVDPTTSPIRVVTAISDGPSTPDTQHTRQAAVLSSLVALVLLAALLIALEVI